jgi:nucleoside-diphosphate-sugar epimerase
MTSEMTTEILVTGATGFLGRRLVAALECAGRGVRQHSSTDGDIARCELPMRGVQHVFHLAARNFVPDSWEQPRAFYEVNVMGTLNVLEHCRRHRAALTLISSYVYGSPQCLPIREDHPLSAFNPYSQTKILAEATARFYEQHHGLRLVVVRPFNLYGPGQAASFLIPTIARQVLDPSVAIVRVKDLRPKRDYLFVDDAVRLLTATLRPEVRGTYNMGSGSSVSVEEVGRFINQAAGVDKPLLSDEAPRPHEVMDTMADISVAEAELGWWPTTKLADGISAVVAALRSKRG